MLQKSQIQSIVSILKKDSQRALLMKLAGFPRPYYCAFLLRDIEWFNTWASSGSIYRRRADHTRNVNCDLRVGSYRYDQVSQGGLRDNDEELESVNHCKVPIDDNWHAGLRLALWRLSEAKFREALADYTSKESARVSTVDTNRRFASFRKCPPFKHITYCRRERTDEEHWVRFCKQASKWLSTLGGLTSNWVEFDMMQMSKVFVNTENRVIVQHQRLFCLNAGMRILTKEGLNLEEDLVINCSTPQELPSFAVLKKEMHKKHAQLLELSRARKIHSFSGPVLLYPKPAGLLFHEAMGHRFEGSRLLSSGEGSTFRDQVGKRILNISLDIYDNPRLKRFLGTNCIGAYDFDDEGTAASKALLVEKGFLKGFLNTRAQIPAEGNVPNGHARSSKHQRPISRMGVFVVESKEGESLETLRELLLREIKRQKKPFGMIVYATSGGETDTAVFDFQAFSGEIECATLLYADGHEVPIRGVNFVGTPLQALNNVVAVSKDLEIDNHYCGAESGMIPVTTIAPAVLLSNLELQAKEEELVTQYMLPRPRL